MEDATSTSSVVTPGFMRFILGEYQGKWSRGQWGVEPDIGYVVNIHVEAGDPSAPVSGPRELNGYKFTLRVAADYSTTGAS
jgi:hypothetical protein